MSNRYNSIVETMRAEAIPAGEVLGDYGPVPGVVFIDRLQMQEGIFTGANIDSPVGTNLQYFDIRDIPSILEAGLFSSIADGLAPNPSVDVPLRWIAVDSLGSEVSQLMQLRLNFETLNAMKPYAFFKFFQEAAVANMDAAIAAGATKTALVFTPDEPLSWSYAAYSMATGWNAAAMQFFAQLTVEHTFPLAEA